MLTTERERKICAKYSAVDETGHVHCDRCPLNYLHYEDLPPYTCKASYHYDRHKREWLWDESEGT